MGREGGGVQIWAGGKGVLGEGGGREETGRGRRTCWIFGDCKIYRAGRTANDDDARCVRGGILGGGAARNAWQARRVWLRERAPVFVRRNTFFLFVRLAPSLALRWIHAQALDAAAHQRRIRLPARAAHAPPPRVVAAAPATALPWHSRAAVVTAHRRRPQLHVCYFPVTPATLPSRRRHISIASLHVARCAERSKMLAPT